MMIFVLPPVALVALVAWLRTGRWFAGAPLIAIAISYVLALSIISIDPYFEDNGSREYVEWRFRLIIALEFAGWLTIPILPAVVLVHAGYRRLFPQMPESMKDDRR